MKRMLIMLLLLVLVVVGPVFAAGEQDKIVIKYADQVSAGHPMIEAAYLFQKKMAELTNGRVEVQVYHSSQLGNLREYMEGVQIGTIEMGMTTTPNMEVYSKKYSVASLPYVFPTVEYAQELLQGKLGDIFNEEAEKVGFKCLAYYFEGPRSIFNSVRPIFTPEDLTGLKLRVMETPIQLDAINAMGASAVPIPYGELYMAIKNGVVDGAENTPVNVINMKFYEVAQYYSMTEHFNNPNMLMIGKEYFESLPKDIQDIIEKTAQECWGEYANELRAKMVIEAMEELRSHGVQINEVDEGPFIELVQTVYKENEDVIGKDLIDLVRQQ